jgi:hypothetical protein
MKWPCLLLVAAPLLAGCLKEKTRRFVSFNADCDSCLVQTVAQGKMRTFTAVNIWSNTEIAVAGSVVSISAVPLAITDNPTRVWLVIDNVPSGSDEALDTAVTVTTHVPG